MPSPSLLQRLKQRKLVQWALAYLAGAWVLVEASNLVVERFHFPEVIGQAVIILAFFGLFLVLILAWYHGEMGRQRVSGPELMMLAALFVVAGVAVAFLGRDEGLSTASHAQGEIQPPLPEDYVAVFPFENLTGDPDLDRLSWYVAHGITTGLEGAPEVRQVGTDKLEEILSAAGDGLSSLEVAENLRVGVAVTGWYALSGDSLELSAEITRVADGELIGSVEGELGPAEDPRQVVAGFRDRVMGGLAILLDEYSVLGGSLPPTYEAFDSHRRGWARWLAGDFEGAVRHYQDSFRQDPTWVRSAISLFVAFQATQEIEKRDSLRAWLDSRRLDMTPSDRARWDAIVASFEGNLEGQYEAARFEYRKDPTGNAMSLATLATRVGRPREALEAMEHVDLTGPIWRDFPYQWGWVPWAHHMLGSYEEELEAARQGLERFPEFLPLRHLEIRALVAMGRLEEVRPILDQAEGIDPDGFGNSAGNLFLYVAGDLARFGYPEESKALAQRALDWFQARNPEGYRTASARSLILKEEPEEALEVLASLVEEDPENLVAHGVRGIALALLGDREGAEAEARWLEELDRPYLTGSNTYWQAAILAHLDRKDEAVRLLGQALREGRDYLFLSSDPNFRPLWGYRPFEDLIAPQG